jgi:hypothetical protein
MKLELGTIVPEALHRQVGWDIRHHFMAEKTVDRFALALPRDRELIRQLAVVYVLEGRTKPPDTVEGGLGPTRQRTVNWDLRRAAGRESFIMGANRGIQFNAEGRG